MTEDKLYWKTHRLMNLGLKEQQRCKKPCSFIAFRDRLHRIRLLKLEMTIDLRDRARC